MDEKELELMLEKKFETTQEELKDLRENGASKEQVEKLVGALKEQGKELKKVQDALADKDIKSIEDKFSAWLTDKKEEIKEIYNKKSGVVEFNPFGDANKKADEANKVPAAITTGSGVDVGTPPHVLHAQLGSFNLRNDNELLNVCTVTNTQNAALTYTEMLPKDGDYNFVDEGGTKPQIDFRWETRFETPKKIAAHEILTEEAVTDFARLDSIAREYLRKRHDLRKVNAVYFEDGTANLPTGATEYGRTFVAGAMAAQLANGTANIMDIINAAKTDVYTTQAFTDEEHYNPNMVMMSPVAYFLNFVAAKDAHGLPLYPTASLFNQVSLGGMTIKPWIKIPDAKIFVADMSKYNIVNYVPFSIRIGWINDQFITNEFTMVGESRFYQYVKNLDQAAFIYDDIATIKAAIEAV